MKTPDFWQKDKGGWKACLLTPVALLYAAGAGLRSWSTKPIHAGVPVLCVGNVTAGGTGKTPVVIALVRAARSMGIRVAVVSRGYGGRLEGPVKVDVARHQVSDVGDEPLLIAAHGETWVAKNRVAGARAAVADGADFIILDDGFQNPTLHKDFSIIVVDGMFGFGNGRRFPAGPLREALPAAIRRADLILLMGRDDAGLTDSIGKDIPVERAALRPKAPESLAPGMKCVAFAGIGLPQKFFSTLRSLGVIVLAEHSFPDHFMYARGDLERLISEARSLEATLVTTAKDYVRLPAEAAREVAVLEVDVDFENLDLPKRLIAQVLNHG
ncbi:tetraacyldisaccharide 4'-kinase [Hwanghaeella grinnelliae]|nr:tetraacyldisaccharide 4'-kinase [Hwanghaeella grinnelliae]